MKRQLGFSLIELIIAMIIVAILAVIAVPAYRDSIRKSNRRAAQSAMMDMANREQQYFVANRAWGTEAEVGCDTLPPEVSDHYTCAIDPDDGPPPSFVITFTAVGTQAADGGPLTLTSTGEKGPAGKW